MVQICVSLGTFTSTSLTIRRVNSLNNQFLCITSVHVQFLQLPYSISAENPELLSLGAGKLSLHFLKLIFKSEYLEVRWCLQLQAPKSYQPYNQKIVFNRHHHVTDPSASGTGAKGIEVDIQQPVQQSCCCKDMIQHGPKKKNRILGLVKYMFFHFTLIMTTDFSVPKNK